MYVRASDVMNSKRTSYPLLVGRAVNSFSFLMVLIRQSPLSLRKMDEEEVGGLNGAFQR